MPQTVFANLGTIISAINQAETSELAAQQLADWLGEQIGSTVIAVVNLESSDLHYYVNPGFTAPDSLIQWMQSPDSWLSWQGWTSPRWHTVADPIPELASNEVGLLMPLRYAGSVRGMIWLAAREDAGQLDTAVLLAGLLAARLDHLKTSGGWNSLVDKLNDFSRALAQQGAQDDIWNAVGERIAELFDATSFFVGFYDRTSALLNIVVAAEDGFPIDVQPQPLQGISKAVITQGSPLYFRDLPAELDRLEAYNTELSPDEPGSNRLSWLGVP
ncbi:MAG: hypothetical protein H0X30_32995, partial [Anaerolineae bacterium]|nr:hypothetical protein [Anaerolineae bacterium]